MFIQYVLFKEENIFVRRNTIVPQNSMHSKIRVIS